MATLGASRETLFSNHMRRLLYGKPGGCTTRKKKTRARRWALEEINMWLQFHLEPERLNDIIWAESNLPAGGRWMPLTPLESQELFKKIGNPVIEITQAYTDAESISTVTFVNEDGSPMGC